MTEYIKGRKGGSKSSSARTPVEEKTSYRSNNMMRVIHLLSHGPIEGFSSTPMKDIYIADTPVQSETNDTDGSPLYNYNGVDFQFRSGTPDQDPVVGFDGASNEVTVGADVKFNKPVTRTVTNPDANAVTVTVGFPSMVSQDKSSGDSVKTTVAYAVDIQPKGGQFYTAGNWEVTFKNTSATQKSHYLRLKGEGPWNIRMRRLTQDSTTQYLQNATQFSSYTEIVDGKFTYPNMAYVALRLIADQFGSTSPTCKYRIKGRIIKVPSNYDPIARTYTGIWDGTFKQAWSNNPAWCFYDLATNDYYGMGRKRVDKWTMYRIGRECDVMVSDGKGGMEPRFTLNVTIKEQKSAMALMDTMASVFRGMAYCGKDRTGTTLLATQDVAKPEDGQKFFGPANTVGMPKISGTRAQDRHTVANVTWRDLSNGGQNVIEQVKINKAIHALGLNETNVTAFACTSAGQAQRLGLWILATEYTESESISFETGYEYGYDLSVGEVVRVNIPWRQTANLSGRVFTGAKQGDTKLHLDATPADKRNNVWTITLHMPDNDFFTTKVKEFDGDIITLADPLTGDVPKYTSWTVESATEEHSLWRISGVKDEGEGKLSITGTSYNPTKYKFVDEGAQLDDLAIKTTLPVGAVSPPTNVSVLPRTFVQAGTVHQGFTVSWSPSDDIRVTGYTVETMAPGDVVWQTRGEIFQPPYEVNDERSGLWKVRVVAITELGQFSPWAYTETTVKSYLQPLPPVSVDSVEGNFEITLSAHNAQRTEQEYEFWRSTVALEGVDRITTNAIRVGVGKSISDTGLEPGRVYFYYVRGTNIYGVSEFYPYSTKTRFDPEGMVNLMHGQLSESMLSKELANKINNPIADLTSFDTRFGLIDKNLSDIQSDMEGVKSGIDTVKTTQSGLSRKIDTVAASVDSANAAIRKEESARIKDKEALTTQVDEMLAKSDAKQRDDWGAAIRNERTARSSDIAASAKDLSTLIANSVSASESAMAAQIEKERKARTEGDEAEASERNALVAKVNESAASIRNLNSAVVEAQRSIARVEESAVAQVDGKIAQATQSLTAEVDELSGHMKSMYVVKLQAGTEDVVAGFGLALDEHNLSDFAIRADRFYITNPEGGNRTPAFSVVNNKVMINEAIIGNIEVTSGMIAETLHSENWNWKAARDFKGMELDFKEGQIRCDDVILKGAIEATEFRAMDEVGNYTCELTGRGIVIKRGDMLIARFGIWES